MHYFSSYCKLNCCMIILTHCTLRLSYVDNFTSCLFDAVWNSSWPFSCTTTRLYTVSHHRTSPTTVCSLLVAEVGRRLRLADARTCVVPRTRTQINDRSFAVAGRGSGRSIPTSVPTHFGPCPLRTQILGLKWV